jgi:hypothetical protein
MNNSREIEEFHFPIVGSRSSGKSALLVSATKMMQDRFSPEHRLKLALSDGARSQVDRWKKRSFSGLAVEEAGSEFHLNITRPDGSHVLVYLHDPAGEDCVDLSRLSTQRAQRYPYGFLLVIDPFSLAAVRAEHQDKLGGPAAQELSPSPGDPLEVIADGLQTLEVRL